MLTIFIKTSLIWLLLLLFYFTFLSREKAPAANRLYLWVGLFLGLIIPFLTTPFKDVSFSEFVEWPIPQVMINSGGYTDAASVSASAPATSTPFNIYRIVFGIWILGAIIQGGILIRDVMQLRSLKRHSRKKQHSISEYYISEKTPSPFSFWKYIFLANQSYTKKELTLILCHENSHCCHGHWLDNIVLAILQMVLWFHPFFYLFQHQIKLNHEFQVDADISEENRYDYGQLLLAQNQKPLRQTLRHTFNYSPLKKRITMMTKTKKVGQWKYLLSLPVFAACFLLMSAVRSP